MSGCNRCHDCGDVLHTVLDGEEWCDRCREYRRYRSHGWASRDRSECLRPDGTWRLNQGQMGFQRQGDDSD
jgi:hypothetical protein